MIVGVKIGLYLIMIGMIVWMLKKHYVLGVYYEDRL